MLSSLMDSKLVWDLVSKQKQTNEQTDTQTKPHTPMQTSKQTKNKAYGIGMDLPTVQGIMW